MSVQAQRDEATGQGVESKTALSAQQKRFEKRGLANYKEFVVGDRGWASFVLFELSCLFVLNLSGLLGFISRSFLLRGFFKKFGKGALLGRGVTIRQPGRVSLGRGAIIDEYAVLDVRSSSENAGDLGIEIGEKAVVGRNSSIIAKGCRVSLASGCNVGSNCRIASESGVEIGESVLIAAYAYIGPGNHRYTDPDVPLIEQGMDNKGPVRIGANAWVGTRATILDGVTIGENAIVGAHSLVKDDVPAGTIVAGVPARVVKQR